MTEKIKATIVNNQPVPQADDGVFLMELELPYEYPKSAAGQFVNVYLNNQSRLLPRPISIYDHFDGHLYLLYEVVGNGTKELSSYKSKTRIMVSTPLGNGFTLPENLGECLLIGGGMGIAPMHYLTKAIYKMYKESSNKPEVSVILGYRNTPFLLDDFQNYCEDVQVSSDNPPDDHYDCWEGNVTVPLKECFQSLPSNVFSCGPRPMLKAINEYTKSSEECNLQVSMEERMGCGFGTCVGCSIKLWESSDSSLNSENIIQKKVCKDGPIFDGRKVVWND